MRVGPYSWHLPGILLGVGALFGYYWFLFHIFEVHQYIPIPQYGSVNFSQLPFSFYKSLWILWAIIIGPLLEELLYRWPLVWLAKKKVSRKAVMLIAAAMLSSLVFGMLHTLHFGDTTIPPNGWVWFGIVMSGPGLIFSTIAIYYKSVATSFVTHATINTILVLT